MSPEDDHGFVDRKYSSSPAPDQTAFRAQLKQFEYPSSSELNAHRRSDRISSRALSDTSTKPAGDASSRRKRPLTTRRLLGREGLGSEDERSEFSETQSSTPKDDPDTPKSKKRRTTTRERSAKDPYSPTNNLVDSLRPGLTLVCIGLNPGLMTAATGHAYAHPSNRFWHILHASGITLKKHHPSETRDLMDLYQIGNTNICARPTRSGDGLSKLELEEGAVILDKKIATYKPQAVVIVGKGIWEAIWMAKKRQKRFTDPEFHWGWQEEDMQMGRTKDEDGEISWPGAKTFVATSTSGLAATLTPAEKLGIWKPLGEWMNRIREEGEASKAHLSA